MINNKISDNLPKPVNSETKEIIELTDEVIDTPDSRKKIIELTDVVGGIEDIGEDIIELTDIIESSAPTDEDIIELTDIIADPEDIIELTDIIADPEDIIELTDIISASENIKPEDIKEDIIDLIDIAEPVRTTDENIIELSDIAEVSTSEEEVIDLTDEIIEEEGLDDLDLTEKVEDSIEELFDKDENIDLTQTTTESEIEDVKTAFEPLPAEADHAHLEDNDFVETTDSALPEDDEEMDVEIIEEVVDAENEIEAETETAEDEPYAGTPAIEDVGLAGDTKGTENIEDTEDTEELLIESESKAEFNPAKALGVQSDTADNFEIEKITSEDQPEFVIIPEEPNGKIDGKIDDRDEIPESITQLEDVSREPELISLSEEQIEAALERVIDKLYADKIEDLIIDVIHKAVTKEITKIKQALLDNTDNVL